MTEESTKNKLRMLEEAQEVSHFSADAFGPEQIIEMNKDLPESTFTLFLPPDYDKRLLPIKARALRSWWEKDEKTRMHARFCLPLTMASGLGFYILSPATFTVEWDGEANHDAQVTIIDGSSHAQIDNHSSFGSFTVQSRFIVRTKNIGDFIYIKGVSNTYRKPFHVMEAMIESWWSPSEFGVVCLVNQPGKFTIEKGEPLAQMFVINVEQAQYGLAVAEGYPPFWKEWSDRRKPEIYDGRNMDYLRGVLPDQTPVCPHMKKWTDTNTAEAPVERTVSQLWSAADVARIADNIDESVRLYNRSLQLAEERGEVTEELLYQLSEVGHQFQEIEKHQHAIRLIEKCVELSERHFPPYGLDFTADLLTDIAYSKRVIGELDKAESLLVESLKRKREQDARPLSLARTLIDLGTLTDFRGRHKEAEPFLTEAKQIYEAHLPSDDPQQLYMKNVYACMLSHIGRYEEAEALYEEVIRERSRIFGEESLEVAFTHNDLGYHYKLMKQYDQSEQSFKRCIEIRRKQLGDDLEVASAYEDLAWMFRDKNDWPKAKKALEQVLAIRKEKLFPRDPGLSAVYWGLLDVCTKMGDLDSADKARRMLGQK
jgi:tetratricopeptide (TPR) repeat protein